MINFREGIVRTVDETQNKPNYAYIAKHNNELTRIKEAILNNEEIKFYNNFIEIGGVSFNVRPEIVRNLMSAI